MVLSKSDSTVMVSSPPPPTDEEPYAFRHFPGEQPGKPFNTSTRSHKLLHISRSEIFETPSPPQGSTNHDLHEECREGRPLKAGVSKSSRSREQTKGDDWGGLNDSSQVLDFAASGITRLGPIEPAAFSQSSKDRRRGRSQGSKGPSTESSSMAASNSMAVQSGDEPGLEGSGKSSVSSFNVSSTNSGGPIVTMRFEHQEDVNGHHVLIGREGELTKCEDEVSAFVLPSNISVTFPHSQYEYPVQSRGSVS